jgi:hypothetical protein
MFCAGAVAVDARHKNYGSIGEAGVVCVPVADGRVYERCVSTIAEYLSFINIYLSNFELSELQRGRLQSIAISWRRARAALL